MISWRIHHKPLTASTNVDAHVGRHGDVFTADFQTAGRGRLDHTWVSPRGQNLLMSVVLDVAGLEPSAIATFPLVVGLSCLEGLSPLPDAALKWPNDILVGGRKLAGILCERTGDCVIAGIGINVGAVPDEVRDRATSLAALRSAVPSVVEVRSAVLARLGWRYEQWRSDGFAAVYPALSAWDGLRGRELAVLQTDGDTVPVRGVCGGIQPDGSLMVGDTPVYAGEAHVL